MRGILSFLAMAGASLVAEVVVAEAFLPGVKLTSGSVARDDSGLIMVAKAGAEFAFGNCATIVAEPGTQFSIGRSFKLSLGTGRNARVPTRVLTIHSGGLDVMVPRTQPISCAVLLAGPGKQQAINRGGRASVRVRKGSVTWVAHESNLMYGRGRGWKRLQEGEMRLITRGFPFGKPANVPGTVQGLNLSAQLVCAGNEGAAHLTARWDELPNVSQYQLSIRDNNGAIVSRSLVEEAGEDLSGLESGSYHVRVRALHVSGAAGEWSSPIALNVIGLSVAGQRLTVENGVVRLLPGRRVALVGVEGLQIAYVGVDAYLPAPASLGLVARRPITVRLRHPRGGESLRLRLEPLTVTAKIAIDRAPSAWPRLGLPVAVNLEDASGGTVPDSFQVTVVATVNLVQMDLDWERKSGVMFTKIPRPSKPGPWVVRFEVFDSTGASIGRNLRDIGYARSDQLSANK